MTEMYRFILSANPCDICAPMANLYPYAPHVPVHSFCDCTVEKIPSSQTCTTELRNIESSEVKFSDDDVRTSDLYNESPNDTPESVPVEVGVIVESWEDPRLPGAIGWNPPSGTLPAAFTLPGHSAGELRITVEVEVTQVMVKAELWEVCRRQPAPGETTGHTLNERKLRIVGGGATAKTAILNVEVENMAGVDEYEPGDEVPV